MTATGTGNYQFVQTGTFEIARKPLTATMVTIPDSETSFVYNGNVQKPNVTVTDGSPLTEGKDYTLNNPGAINVSTGNTASVTGVGNYTGTVNSPAYAITALDISSTANITLIPLSSYVYDGNNKVPGVQQVTVGNLVVPSTSYAVTYDNNKNASTNTSKAKVIVTANGNFTGSREKEFSIEQKEVNSSMITLSGTGFDTGNYSFTYDGNSHTPTVTVADGTAMTTDDYDVTSNTGGTAVGSYSVTITGKKNYKGTASRQYSIINAGSAGFDVVAIGAQTYTGSAIEPTVTVYKHGTTTPALTENNDYTVAYTDNINVGTATVTVTGMGNYGGTQTVNFTINPKALVANETTLSATDFTYNTTEQKPVVTVKDGTTPLVLNKDYNLTWPTDIINQGSKTITINGTGNYTGSFSKTYTINQLSLNNTSTNITLSANSFVYDASPKEPEVLLVKVGNLVVPSEAYTFSYASNTNVGTATVTVTAVDGSNFKDSKNTTFSITKRTITSDMVKLNTNNFVYNGKVQQPVVQVETGYTIVAADTTLTYVNTNCEKVRASYRQFIA